MTGCHLSGGNTSTCKNRDAKSFILPSTFQLLKSTLWDGFETLPISGTRAGTRGSRCEMLRRLRHAVQGELRVAGHLRPRCKPFREEFPDVAGMVNLRCIGCALRKVIYHFSRHWASANAARKQSALAMRGTSGGSRWPGYALVELPSGDGRNGGAGWLGNELLFGPTQHGKLRLGEPGREDHWGFTKRPVGACSGKPWRLFSRLDRGKNRACVTACWRG